MKTVTTMLGIHCHSGKLQPNNEIISVFLSHKRNQCHGFGPNLYGPTWLYAEFAICRVCYGPSLSCAEFDICRVVPKSCRVTLLWNSFFGYNGNRVQVHLR